MCRECGARGPLEVHHIVPVAGSASNELFYDMNNLVVLCTDCHFEKSKQARIKRMMRKNPDYAKWRAWKENQQC